MRMRMRNNTAGLRDYIGGSRRACVSMLILSLVPAVSLLLTTRVDGEPWVSDPLIVSTPLLLRSRRKSHNASLLPLPPLLSALMSACSSILIWQLAPRVYIHVHTCRSQLPHAQLITQSTSAGERASAIPGQKRGAL